MNGEWGREMKDRERGIRKCGSEWGMGGREIKNTRGELGRVEE